jgi:capsular polysaccharide biosynthesis protein
MLKYRTLEEFCDRALRTADEACISDSLTMIVDFVNLVISYDSSRARVFTSKELDLLCLELGRRTMQITPPEAQPSRSVFLATAIYKTGGHTRVMKDLIDADPGAEKFILLTDVLHNIKVEDVPTFLDPEKVSICPKVCLEERVHWVQQELLRIAPQRIYLLLHHFDAVAVAAVQPGFGEHVFYVHNCDHSLALGPHIPHAIHVDLHAKGFFHCREIENLENNVVWPLVSERPNAPSLRKFVSKGRLKTCTSGGLEKFESHRYSISYADVVPRIIKAADGIHLHIGYLSETIARCIRANLDKSGIAQDRFVQIPYVNKLSQAFVDLGVDAYITSFPLGGGLAAIEAMSAGLPIIAHSNYRTIFFSDDVLVYPEVMVWRKVSELENILSSLTQEDLTRHSSLSQAFFEKRHLPVHLKDAIASTLARKDIERPPRPVHYTNPLQCFLDEQAEPQSLSDEQAASTKNDSAQPKEHYARPLATLPWRLELGVAKLLCTIGLTCDGAFLWNRAHTRRRKTLPNGEQATSPKIDSGQPKKDYAPVLARVPWRIELEVAKLLCTMGLTRDGAFLWDRANARRHKAFITRFVVAVRIIHHAVTRHKNPIIVRSEHNFGALKFLLLCLRRFGQGLGGNIAFDMPYYISFRARSCPPQSILKSTSRGTDVLSLYLASIFKSQGFHHDAEAILRGLTNTKIADLALLALGDLLHVQARWASEFISYGTDKVALNPFALFARHDVVTWHVRQFDEAIHVLQESIRLNPGNPDTWWMLWRTAVTKRDFSLAQMAIAEYARRAPESVEANFALAVAAAGADFDQSIYLHEYALGNWSGAWRVASAALISGRELASQNEAQLTDAGPARSLEIRSISIMDKRHVGHQMAAQFDPPYVAIYGHAEVMPQFGLIYANDGYLITDSLHHDEVHYSVFTPSISVQTGNKAIIYSPKPKLFPERGCIYIGHNSNYYHWLIDELPRLQLLDHTSYAANPVLVDLNASQWQYEVLHRLGVSKKRMKAVNFNEFNKFSDLIVPSRLSTRMIAHPVAVEYLRSKLIPGSESLTPKAGKRIYLLRRSGIDRSFLNERQILRQFKRAGFHFVDTGTMTIQEQIDLFADAECVAGPGGAAFANLVFAPRGCRAIVLGSSSMICETFSSLCACVGQSYFSCIGKTYPRAHENWISSRFDFEVSEEDIALSLKLALGYG